MLAEFHHLEWSQGDERQPSRQLPSSLLPVLKAQTTASIAGTDSQHSNSRKQGKSGENGGPWGDAPLPPVTHFLYSSQPLSNAAGKDKLLFPTNCSYILISLNSITCMARSYLLTRERGKAGKGDLRMRKIVYMGDRDHRGCATGPAWCSQ